MTTAQLDNTATADLNRTITWQFDNAVRLCEVIGLFKDFFQQATTYMWGSMKERLNLNDIDECDDFGLSVWGKLLGIPRPTITVDGTTDKMSKDLYRKILIGRLRLANSNASIASYTEYVNFVFGNNNIVVTDGEDMSISFSIPSGSTVTDEMRAIFDSQTLIDIVFAYPAGVKSHEQDDGPVFGFSEQVRTQVIEGVTTQVVSTSIILTIKNTSAATISIPATAKFTYNSHDFIVSEASTIDAGSTVNLRFVYEGKDYVPARAVIGITDGTSAIANLAVTNQYRSMTDFKIANFENSVFAWNRFIDR